ncbi:hypothetical protein DERP_004603 [Dermatophagoides pteronyssinus]|uniref:Chitin-binding type-2 domain-containing protein n=1 Tax=Dermatophagoides pteronyssinus TaxID=6956 RepID=A0ABQ8JP84_DERPT|nr:hypothetical protein DERP_004603 [Dermatophagoides pteronyssinus]
MKIRIFCLLFLTVWTMMSSVEAAREPIVSPYVDATRMSENFLVELYQQTGLKSVTLAFVLGTGFGCTPSWGGEQTLNDPKILNGVKAFRNIGGKVILATGGAMGPYLESTCSSADQLAQTYQQALNIVDSKHLDIDIEASVNVDIMLNALKILRTRIPELTISFTMMVQGDDYGIVDSLGVDILKRSRQIGVDVNIVNGMTMEFGSRRSSWGDAVIAASESLHRQLQQIWPEKSSEELYTMIGVTPMIGRNFNGKIFQIEHAKQLIEWSKQKQIGHLSFWSVGRDNGDCPGGGISPSCSSISQQKFEFSKIFQQYSGNHIPDKFSTTTTTTMKPDPNRTTTSKPPKPIDCSTGIEYIVHETYCDKYYWCFQGKPHLEQCPNHLVWDPKINSCNYAENAKRTDCIQE